MIDVGVLLAVMFVQSFEQRGFVENSAAVYPQTAPNDSGHVVDEVLFREEASYKFTPWFTLSGAFDARTDSHRQTARDGIVGSVGLGGDDVFAGRGLRAGGRREK